MIGDRILITEHSKNNANKILQKLQGDEIILIYGVSGSQKTETADCLQELLFKKNKQSIVISLDDFYLVHPTVRYFNREKLGIESVGTSEIDWNELERICEDFQNKKPIRIKRVHKYADIVEHVTLETDGISCLIIEGLYSGYLKKDGFGDVAVYLEGNPSQTLEFRKLRGKEDESDEFRQKVVQREFNITSQLKRHADLNIQFED